MRVAITGGIAEGKSTVLGYLAEMGYEVQSADRVARIVYELPEVQRRLAGVADLPIPVDRELLRKALAHKHGLRQSVNAIMHPLIVQQIRVSSAVFFEVPLLFEAVMQSEFDRVWVVTCGAAEKRKRLIERYGAGESTEALIAAQLPSRAKTPFSDRIVRTNAEPESVRRLLSEAVNALFGS